MDRVAIYGRVSTSEQTSDNQINFLQEIVNRNGLELVQTYVDEGISGTKGRDKRPEFDRLCKDMIRRKFNRILVWDISRLGRSLQHLVECLAPYIRPLIFGFSNRVSGAGGRMFNA